MDTDKQTTIEDRHDRMTRWKRLRIRLALWLAPTGVYVNNGMIWPQNVHIELGSNEKVASLNGRTWYHVD